MQADRAFLQDLCNLGRMGICTPFAFVVGPELTFDVATDGAGLAFVRDATTVPPGEHVPIDAIRSLVAIPEPCIGQANLRQLIAWAALSWTWWSDPSGELSQRVPAALELRCASLFGCPVDRWLIWKFLRHFDGHAGAVRIHVAGGQKAPLHFVAEDWRVVLMPIRPDHGYFLGEPFPNPARPVAA